MQLQRSCCSTLRWLILFSLGLMRAAAITAASISCFIAAVPFALFSRLGLRAHQTAVVVFSLATAFASLLLVVAGLLVFFWFKPWRDITLSQPKTWLPAFALLVVVILFSSLAVLIRHGAL
jgi:hypothetical protein